MTLKKEDQLALVKNQVTILGGFVISFWVLEIIDQVVLNNSLNNLGIKPRRITGLRGIILAPFLHGNYQHLISNTIPFITLGWLVMAHKIKDFWFVTLLTMLVGGGGVWVFGATNSVHIGASILIFGYLGFLLFRGYFQRDLRSISLSLLVCFLYGSLVWGVLPSDSRISWQGHLFGFIGGFIAARMIGKARRDYN
jgi:membrane associated rhomboid family serine protease